MGHWVAGGVLRAGLSERALFQLRLEFQKYQVWEEQTNTLPAEKKHRERSYARKILAFLAPNEGW